MQKSPQQCCSHPPGRGDGRWAMRPALEGSARRASIIKIAAFAGRAIVPSPSLPAGRAGERGRLKPRFSRAWASENARQRLGTAQAGHPTRLHAIIDQAPWAPSHVRCARASAGGAGARGAAVRRGGGGGAGALGAGAGAGEAPAARGEVWWVRPPLRWQPARQQREAGSALALLFPQAPRMLTPRGARTCGRRRGGSGSRARASPPASTSSQRCVPLVEAGSLRKRGGERLACPAGTAAGSAHRCQPPCCSCAPAVRPVRCTAVASSSLSPLCAAQEEQRKLQERAERFGLPSSGLQYVPPEPNVRGA